MSTTTHRGIPFLLLYPINIGVGLGQSSKQVLMARNYMKCADLHTEVTSNNVQPDRGCGVDVGSS